MNKPTKEAEVKILPVEAHVLRLAEKCICSDRKDQYGNAENAFEDVAAVWDIVLKNKLSENITPGEVALMMAALKLVREVHKPKMDNLVDLAGYAALKARIDNTNGVA